MVGFSFVRLSSLSLFLESVSLLVILFLIIIIIVIIEYLLQNTALTIQLDLLFYDERLVTCINRVDLIFQVALIFLIIVLVNTEYLPIMSHHDFESFN